MLTDKQIEQLFKSFDTEGTGYIGRNELRYFCSQYDLGPEAADAIFEELDGDRDGRIDFEDFRCGFQEFLAPRQEVKEAAKSIDDVWTNDLWSASGLRDDQVKTLHKELQSIDSPHLVNTFESVVEGLLENMRHLQEENKQLETLWKREKKENERHLHRLEEEMDTQVRDMEIKMKQKAREEFEADRKSLRTKMTSEMDRIQDHVFLVEKVATWLKTSNSKWSDPELCNKLQEAIDENKQLRLSLIDTQTNIVLMKNELQMLRKSYEQKCKELDCERQRISDVLHEQDNLSRQLHLLHDANKTLQDINDSLRENTSHHLNRIYRVASGSTIGDYLKDDFQILPSNKRPLEGDDCSEVDFWEPSHNIAGLIDEIDVCDDVDSGMSTLRSMSAVSEDFESGRFSERNDQPLTSTTSSTSVDCQTILQYDTSSKNESHILKPTNEVKCTESQHSSLSPGIKELKKRLGMDPELASYGRSAKYVLRILPPISEQNAVESKKNNEENPKSSLTRQYSDERFRATGPAEKTLKIVFVGDSSVGKTSFILRLGRGTFQSHVNSTLGLDIQSKILNIDGHNVCLQLWDTAGQERFRSITQSYFRNVQGVMLLYDCTEERSFLSVRQWMEAIGESCPATVPVQIVGNKVDLRDASPEGRKIVTVEDGMRLAKTFGALFIEASAQTGYNVMESAVNLIRNLLSSQERISEEVSSTICLKDSGPKKKACCR